MPKLLNNKDFLKELSQLYYQGINKGSVFVNMKRLSYKTPPSDNGEYPVIVRGALGKKKISTLVHPDDVDTFNEGYSNVIRFSMLSLKKKVREKKAKSKKGE
ncbi:RNA-binding signal recognition particle subunit srp14 [Clydaea vesicula]|uniref:Signal recognition particle subunit SRP14 n=1 Tax=Clydaea vesicula TaxID=447962 RepID=A0AAD5XWZ7_9FUNG|nr:RNA-binding signal recognition particle subunit srp14 [Clydaea vesicula]KAJ3392808.1 RNA-binding signal recognition particle subunit srp14 [Lobulomyces angularis]